MNTWARPFEWKGASPQPGSGALAHPGQIYFAFLSYSHADAADADWLHGELERFRVPSSLVGRLTEHGAIPRRLTPIFRDRHELAAADDLGEEINEALGASRCLVVLCSPAAARSKWTNAEIETFKRLHPEGCIIAAIVDGEPFASDTPGREHEECLPPALRQKYDKRGRPTGRRAEPLAADLREGHGGRRVGFLKIVAGLLGIGLDDLVQREQLRRQRRLAGITAGSFVGMLVAGGLAVTAIQARDSARDQRREAEGLVAFMLGDLKDKLEPIGRLDALDGVGSRVLAYYSRQDTSELSDSALLQRSQALSLTAEVAYLRGDLDTAQRLYGEAMDGTGEAIRRNPDDPQRLYDHAQNVALMGEVARLRGRMADAEAAAREYKRLAEAMVAIEPDNMRWRMEVQYASANLGIVYLGERRFSDSSRQFEQALQTIQSLTVADPQNADYQKSLSESLAWLADSRSAEGRLDDAIRLRQRQVDLLEELMRKNSGDVTYQQRAIPAHQAIGRLHAARGDLDRGIGHLRTAVEYADRLIPNEPSNTNWQNLAAAARLNLAEHLLAAGRGTEAVQQTRRGCDAVQRLIERDPSVLAWRLSARKCFSARTQLALAAGAHSEALGTARRAIAMAGTDRPDGEDAYSIAKLHRLAGDAEQGAGNSAAAQSHWKAALAMLPTGVSERPYEMNERVLLLERLGRDAEARPIAMKLRSIGYHRLA